MSFDRDWTLHTDGCTCSFAVSVPTISGACLFLGLPSPPGWCVCDPLACNVPHFDADSVSDECGAPRRASRPQWLSASTSVRSGEADYGVLGLIRGVWTMKAHGAGNVQTFHVAVVTAAILRCEELTDCREQASEATTEVRSCWDPEPKGDAGDRAGGSPQPHGEHVQDRVLRVWRFSHQVRHTHTLRRRAQLMELACASSFSKESGPACLDTRTCMAEWPNIKSHQSLEKSTSRRARERTG